MSCFQTSFEIPLSFFKHTARSSLDSSAADIHIEGGWKYLRKNPVSTVKCIQSICRLRSHTEKLNKPFAGFAKVQSRLLWYSLCDVNFCSQACHTHICRIWFNLCSTFATQAEIIEAHFKKLPPSMFSV